MRFNFFTNSFEKTNENHNKIAVRGSDGDLSWLELQSKVNSIEMVLKDINIPKGHPVLLYGHKEKMYPVWILALMKNDIPYVPLDSIYPWERIEGIAKETESQLLVNLSSHNVELAIACIVDSNLKVSYKNELDFTNRTYGKAENPLRYILYTSGSTGKPKGVMIAKEAVLSFITWIEEEYDFVESDVFMNQSLFTFDVSLYDTLSAFHLGASIFLADRELTGDAPKFFEEIKKYACTIWTSTPSFVYIFLRQEGFNSTNLPSIRTFLFAGEPIPSRTIDLLDNQFSNRTFWNAYGPTEATITTTLVQLTPSLIQKYGDVPIGYPKNTSEILIENESNDPSLLGEMILIGKHVAEGYFKRPELSKLKFTSINGKKAFRTGDLGFYKDGLIFFRGRNDDQIKMHGYRIELGEIASRISELPYVDEAVCIALKKNGEVKKLVAFAILRKEASVDDLRHRATKDLDGKLPSYMMPGDVRAIIEWPINANHKIDKLALEKIYLKRN
ncbi:MAG: AMP-binding protein [Flavobacteriales bacterium]|nr:AMP-binding protein [Flavobacteriales bacterium]